MHVLLITALMRSVDPHNKRVRPIHNNGFFLPSAPKCKTLALV